MCARLLAETSPPGLGAQVCGVPLERAEKLLDSPAESGVDHTEVLDDEQRARRQLVELLGGDHPVQLLALVLNQAESTEIAAVRLEENRLEALDVLLRLLPAEVLTELG